MKCEDLGIDVRTGRHNRVLTHAETKFLGIIWEKHQGKEFKISATDLAIAYADMMGARGCHQPNVIEHWKREVRHLQNHLLTEHSQVPILSAAGDGGGYWIAESEGEAAAFYNTFRRRGMTGLVKASRGKQAALVDMVQQLSFEFDELEDKTGFKARIRPVTGMPTPIEVVDAFLGRMLGNPEKFADGLRKIGAKYGSILLPRDRVMAMKRKAAELQEMVANL